jgi:chloramphenicol O-acetyltransferase type A
MPAKLIDLTTWPRRDHFRLYTSMDYPYFSLTVEVDVTDWFLATRAAGHPVFAAMVHRMSAAANAVETFCTRIRGDQVVLHDRISPSFPVPWRGDCFNFCTVQFEPALAEFLPRCAEAIATAQASDCLTLDPAGSDDMIFLGCLPWFGFTSMTHAVDARGGDSFPRISWGKITERDARHVMPVNFQLHHALTDGIHVARFLELL